jgi:uncharacterized protein (DUF1800 family)
MPAFIAPVLPRRTHIAALLASLCLAACGGGGGSETAASETSGTSADTPQGGQADPSNPAGGGTQAGTDGTQAGTETAQGVNVPAGTTRADAFRLLTQASFGPTEAEVSRTMTLGAAGWVDEQLAKPARAVHLARWNNDDAAAKLKDPKATAGAPSVVSSFYQQALQADDQLRQRAVFALSQIFVVSTYDLASERGQAVASWVDMLGRNAFGNFRTLLQDVAMHPAMGLYLSHLKNKKEDLILGRVPDQNFAREIMQLFTIGLVQLNNDGTPKRDGNGALIDTYGAADIEGLSSVFTGFSWGGPDQLNSRFAGSTQDPQRLVIPMQGYPQYHSVLPKSFLGATVAPQSPADPAASLKTALDTLFAHPNVGPFISRQLIQRLVTSAPSPAYVARVTAVFNNNGLGVRGDMKAVFRAILMDNEARSATLAAGPQYGKVKEPVLRLTAFLRAFGAKSDSGKVLMNLTDDAGLQLAQTPLRSPSVFNFYRPGYIPSGGEAASLGMTLPEMQITDESSVAGYANYMIIAVKSGVGPRGIDNTGPRPDLQPNYTALQPLALDPAGLVDKVNARYFGAPVGSALRTEQINAVTSIFVPALKPDGSNKVWVDKAKANRVWAAVAMPLVTPEFIVQK